MRRIAPILLLAGLLVAGGAAPAAPPAAAGPPPPPPAVAFVGDSIGRDAEPEIRAAVEDTHPIAYYHAIGAGYIGYHLPLLRPIVKAPGGPDIVVAELGTGDAFWGIPPRRFESEMRRFLDAVTPHTSCVVWVDQKPGGNRAYPTINQLAGRYNRIVHRVVREYPTARYLHYSAWTELAGAPSPYFLGDYLHLTAAGERELGRLVASAVRGCDDGARSGPFWDVPDTQFGSEAINWAAARGLLRGYDNASYRARVGLFRPTITRGQGLVAVWRLMGAPDERRPHGWSDGTPATARALRWAWWSGAVPRVPHGSGPVFEPDVAMTRAELVDLLWRAAGSPAPFRPHGFTDPIPPYLRPALRWAVAEGIVAPGPTFGPDRPVERYRIALWLRATDAALHPAPPPPGPPAPTTTAPATTLPATTLPAPTTAPLTTIPPTTPPGGLVPDDTLVP